MFQTEFIQAFPESQVLLNEPLSHYSYTKTGGPADLLVFPESRQALQAQVAWLKDHKVPFTVLGNASNVIIKDGGIRGAVLILSKLDKLEIQEDKLVVEAGHSLIGASRAAGAQGLTGLEFACGIPGSVGGAIYMNAGAYGGEVQDVVEWVESVDPEGQVHHWTPDQLDFSYRHSRFQASDHVVLAVGFALKKGNLEEIQAKMADLTHQRESKQPLEYPSCGSVFKRPPGHFTGQLIQEAGLQGFQIGGAQVSKKHAGFIVNIDGATATDYLAVIHHVQEVIWDRNKVRLVPEVKILGEDPQKEV